MRSVLGRCDRQLYPSKTDASTLFHFRGRVSHGAGRQCSTLSLFSNSSNLGSMRREGFGRTLGSDDAASSRSGRVSVASSKPGRRAGAERGGMVHLTRWVRATPATPDHSAIVVVSGKRQTNRRTLPGVRGPSRERSRPIAPLLAVRRRRSCRASAGRRRRSEFRSSHTKTPSPELAGKQGYRLYIAQNRQPFQPGRNCSRYARCEGATARTPLLIVNASRK